MTLADYLKQRNESQPSFARRVGVTQSAVAQWVAGNNIQAERVLAVAAATNWAVTPHELRPDLYPHPSDGMRAERVA